MIYVLLYLLANQIVAWFTWKQYLKTNLGEPVDKWDYMVYLATSVFGVPLVTFFFLFALWRKHAVR